MKLLLCHIFKPKIYKRYKKLHWWKHRIDEYNQRLANGEIREDDILAYLYYFQEGSWDDLINRFGETRVRQYEAIGYLKHYDKNGFWI